MICRISGLLEGVNGIGATIAAPAGDVAREVLLPAYLAARWEHGGRREVTLHTLEYLEAQGQGTSFIPRLVGFESARDRAFFQLLTTVKGIGNRKALRAMAAEPGAIARAIVGKDTKALTKLPEVGKRLAETIIAELSGKVEGYLAPGEVAELEAGSTPPAGGRPAGAEEAVDALMALGEQRTEAERLVDKALARAAAEGRELADAGDVLGAVYAARR